jgi:hypothetical protein
MSDAAAPLPAAAISHPRAWADANDPARIPAGVIGFAGGSCSRAAACDSFSPVASRYGGVMLAISPAPRRARLRLTGRRNNRL